MLFARSGNLAYVLWELHTRSSQINLSRMHILYLPVSALAEVVMYHKELSSQVNIFVEIILATCKMIHFER